MAHNYARTVGKNEAAAAGIVLPISFKSSVEVCSFVRGKSLSDAKRVLEKVIKLKQAVPFKRYNKEIAHNKGVGAGRYPVKTCTYIKKVLENAETNAQMRGMSTANLVVKHIVAQKGASAMHYGRQNREMKRTHVEVILTEGAAPKLKKKPVKKETTKTESQKKEPQQEEKKIAPAEKPKEELKAETQLKEGMPSELKKKIVDDLGKQGEENKS